jgi:hypothetical protein
MALIPCPECGRDISGEAARCPHCSHPISRDNETTPLYAISEVPFPPPKVSNKSTNVTAVAGASQPAASHIGQQFACEEGIDLNETFGDAVPSQRQVDALRKETPEVESAYQPSGALPATALLLLLLGSVVGCVGGAIAGTVIAGAGLALSAASNAYGRCSSATDHSPNLAARDTNAEPAAAALLFHHQGDLSCAPCCCAWACC